ncbi:MAG: response regulator [Nitrospirae bacterium]|nr:response regulator [Nitrospirota bacterium]
MSTKQVFVCVKKDIQHPIGWALKELDKLLAVKYFDTTKLLGTALANKQDCDVVILDSIMGDESTLGFAKELKTGMPSLKILLIASSGTTKQELVSIIQEKTANGVLMRPFTTEQVSDYMYKLCGLQKPSETPWYMQTGLK